MSAGSLDLSKFSKTERKLIIDAINWQWHPQPTTKGAMVLTSPTMRGQAFTIPNNASLRDGIVRSIAKKIVKYGIEPATPVAPAPPIKQEPIKQERTETTMTGTVEIGVQQPVGITAQIQDVTPEQALEWLTDPKYKSANRRLRKSKLAQYISDMKAGRWTMTGEAIKFDKDGRLIDGQHRLTACVETGVTFRTLVIQGLEPEAQDLIDTGAARTAGDMLGMRGFQNWNALAATARVLVAMENGQNMYGNTPVATHGQIRDYAEKHPDLEAMLGEFHSGIRKVTSGAGPVAACIYLAMQHNPEKGREFAIRLTTGEGLESGNPIYALREKLLAMRTEQKRQPVGVTVSAVLRVYVTWADGKTMRTVRLYGKQGAFIPAPVLS